jgi:hypothetical protein
MFVPDPGSGFFSIPDPGVKKAQDTGSASQEKYTRVREYYTVQYSLKTN